MKVIVAGGDGFIGWPLSLRLSSEGHEVLIIDNLYRRKIDEENGYSSISPIKTIEERIAKWKEITGKTINFLKIDIAAQKDKFFETFESFNPDAIVHLAELKSAPYSMKNIKTIDETYTNNTQATLNVLLAMMKYNPKCHLVHIGTMGVYGYGVVEGTEVPEGYCMAKINCTHTEKCECKPVEIVHPYYPGSVYHMTKCLDNVTLLNFHKYFNLKITELHQGIVWGVSTPETEKHPDLCNRIDVDSDFGTVLNRFCSQIACGHPLTIYGTGEQTRAFININDSVNCLMIALKEGQTSDVVKINILNQMTSTHKLNDLKDQLLEMYPEATCNYIDNPRAELAGNSLIAKNDKFKKLGHKGIEINPTDLKKLVEACRENKERYDMNKGYIQPISFWKGAKN